MKINGTNTIEAYNGLFGIDDTAAKVTYCTANTYVSRTELDNVIRDAMKKPEEPEVRPETTTKLDIRYNTIYVKHYKDGFFKNERRLMPDIADIKIHNKTVVMTFSDNTKTVAALDSEDTFSLEQGISICITKKLLGENGGAIYNKLIKRALKVKKQNEAAVAKQEKEKEEAKQRKAKALERHQKKQAKKRESRISEMAEAYIRAMKHFKGKI